MTDKEKIAYLCSLAQVEFCSECDATIYREDSRCVKEDGTTTCLDCVSRSEADADEPDEGGEG